MDTTRDYHPKGSISDKETQRSHDITYMWNLKQETNLSTKQKQTRGRRTDLCLPRRAGLGGEMESEVRVSRWKLLYTEQINNKVLLWSTWNYSQYTVINHMEKDIKNIHI